MAARHHFEKPFFRGKQRFSPLPVVDISLQEVPKDDAPFRISQGEAARVEPAVDPIRTAQAGLNVERRVGFERPPPRGEDIWEIIRMNGVGGWMELQLLPEEELSAFAH